MPIWKSISDELSAMGNVMRMTADALTYLHRGSMKHVLIQYTHEMLEQFMNARKDRVFITHVLCDRNIIDAVHEYISALEIFDEIIETAAGSVISNHCGPGTLGVLFMEKE